MKKGKNQAIKCNVENCKHHDDDCCKLREIEVKKQCGCDDCTCKEETICSSYEADDLSDDSDLTVD